MGLLITGGFGYVGSALLETIAKNKEYKSLRRRPIFVFDKLQRQTGFCVYRKAKEKFPKLHFILGDITNIKGEARDSLKKAIEKSRRVIHLCAITQQPFSRENEPIILGGTKAILQMVQELNPKCSRVVNLSTTNAYGYFPGDSTICGEETLPNPVNLYAENKVKAEKICREFWEKFKLPIVTLRMSTNFGYSDGIRLDFFLNNIIWNALFNQKVAVFGRRDNWRPFIHVQDAARAILKAALAPKARFGEVYNVGSEHLNLKLADIVEEVKTVVKNYRKDMPEFVFDSDSDNSIKGESYRVNFSKFRGEFKFTPKISLVEGIKELSRKLLDKWKGNFF